MEKHKGRYLGDKLTEELLTAIREYDTSKIDKDDYFVINGIKFYVDGWIFPNEVSVSKEHHITIIPEKSIPTTNEKCENNGYYNPPLPSLSWFCNPLNPYSTWFWDKIK
jgi:hypothetical protein